MEKVLELSNVGKSFTLHVQGGVTLPVFKSLELAVNRGECLALMGASGVGKSTLMRMIYANYVCTEGSVNVLHAGQWVDITTAHPHTILDVRKRTMGYVSQFLRVVPRVCTLDIVSEPLRGQGIDAEEASSKAMDLLRRLNIPERLWSLSPLTFSGGEQQRVNIARGLIYPYPILLLDEPTASLDAENKAVVLSLINEARERGTAIVGIFHDKEARDQVVTREFHASQYVSAAA